MSDLINSSIRESEATARGLRPLTEPYLLPAEEYGLERVLDDLEGVEWAIVRVDRYNKAGKVVGEGFEVWRDEPPILLPLDDF